MDQFRVIEIQKNVYAKNDEEAQKVREEVQSKNVFLVNVMSSPGSGKTTTLKRTINDLKAQVRFGVIEADIDSDVDAKTIYETGARVIQLHTGGMCHLDANSTRQGINTLGTDNLDLIFLENIGNLVCPASFDTGAHMNLMILSVPEGDDKPLKYPKMFKIVDCLLINKIDALDYFDFDLEAVKQRAEALNPNIKIFYVSARNGKGFEEFEAYLLQKLSDNRGKMNG